MVTYSKPAFNKEFKDYVETTAHKYGISEKELVLAILKQLMRYL